MSLAYRQKYYLEPRKERMAHEWLVVCRSNGHTEDLRLKFFLFFNFYFHPFFSQAKVPNFCSDDVQFGFINNNKK